MCGIVVLVDPAEREDVLVARVEQMTEALRHRGPDDSGSWVDPAAGVGLGHRRLSIIDLSPAGHQPMLDRGERWVVTYNGEIYNFVEIRRELEQFGIAFRGASDTEVLVEAIARWGVPEAARRCRGMFAFAAYDRQERMLHLARDRMGEKPLYHGWFGGRFFAASELKAMRQHPAFRPDLDRDAITSFLRYNHVPTPWSIYRGIHKLEPGTVLTVDPTAAGSVGRSSAYWSLQDVASRPPQISDRAAAAASVAETLRASVAEQMVSDVPLGAFLSGGIDSSTVVALMQEHATHAVRTFSIGFDDPALDEAPFARAVAERLGTDHTQLYVSEDDARAVIPELPTMYDEPFADSSQIPTALVSRLARSRVTVALSGDGGDELFAGYGRYARMERRWGRLAPWPLPVRRGLAAGLRAVPGPVYAATFGLLSRLTSRQFAGARSGMTARRVAHVLSQGSADELYRYLVSQRFEPERAVIGGTEPLIALTDERAYLSRTNLVERAMFHDARNYLPDDILVKVDRASMAASLEVRVPMLDVRMVELAWSLTPDVRHVAARPKWLLREILREHVPDELIDRPKMGFGVPLNAWLRGPLREWAEDLLSPDVIAAEGLLDVASARSLWGQHLSGVADHGYPLWGLLMLRQWNEAQR